MREIKPDSAPQHRLSAVRRRRRLPGRLWRAGRNR